MHIQGAVAVIDYSGDEPAAVICSYHVVRDVTVSRDDGVVGDIQSYVDQTDFENRGWNAAVATTSPKVRNAIQGPPATGSDDLFAWFADQVIATAPGWSSCTRQA